MDIIRCETVHFVIIIVESVNGCSVVLVVKCLPDDNVKMTACRVRINMTY